MTMHPLAGRTALITGASTGIGRAIALALAAEGVHVALAARTRETLEDAATACRALGVEAHPIPTDVADRPALERLASAARSKLGRVELLVNNAGIDAFAHYDRLSIDEIVWTIDVNLTASLVLTRLVLPDMRAAGQGHVVNVSSTAGKRGPAFGAAYGASKAGLIAFTQGLRTELHGTGVSASVICPGFTSDGGIYERLKQRIGRGTPPWIGGTTADRVAQAVVRAIRRDRPEVVVNSPPFRPLAAFAEIFPRAGDALVRLATRRWLKKLADARENDERDAAHRDAA